MKALLLIAIPVPMLLLFLVALENQDDPKTVGLCLAGVIIYAVLVGILDRHSNLIDAQLNNKAQKWEK